MTVEKRMEGGTAVLVLDGWMDTRNASVLAQALNDLDDGVERLVLDMGKLEYISSAGIRQILIAHKLMRGALTLRNLTPEVLSVLRLTGLDESLNIEA